MSRRHLVGPDRWDADRRARSLLLSVLSPEEQKQWDRDRQVVITGSNGGKYMIGRNATVSQWKKRHRYWSPICVHVREGKDSYGYFPEDDQVAAMVLAIKSNEKKFRFQVIPGREPWGGPVTLIFGTLTIIVLIAMLGIMIIRLIAVLTA